MATLRDYYENTCRTQLQETQGYTNVMEIPRIEKVVLNMGLGEAVQNPKIVEKAANQLTQIAGQKAVVTRAKKSIAGFKLVAGLHFEVTKCMIFCLGLSILLCREYVTSGGYLLKHLTVEGIILWV